MYLVIISDIADTDDFVEIELSHNEFHVIYHLVYELLKKELDIELFNRIFAMADGFDVLDFVDLPAKVFNQIIERLNNSHKQLSELMKKDLRFIQSVKSLSC